MQPKIIASIVIVLILGGIGVGIYFGKWEVLLAFPSLNVVCDLIGTQAFGSTGKEPGTYTWYSGR